MKRVLVVESKVHAGFQSGVGTSHKDIDGTRNFLINTVTNSIHLFSLQDVHHSNEPRQQWISVNGGYGGVVYALRHYFISCEGLLGG